MRRIFSFLVAITFGVVAFGQYVYTPATGYGNPGGVNDDDQEFPVGQGLPTTWDVILGPSQATPAWSSIETIPFTFNFNGNAVTEYKVSSSGVLTFTTSAVTAPSYTNSAIPNASIPDNSIMVWGIEGTGSNDNIVTQVWGSAPDRQLWVFFSSYTAGSWTYWSIVLEETSDAIYIVDQRHSTAATPQLTAGIQIDGANAVSVCGSPNLTQVAGADATDADNWYYVFTLGTQPDYDMAGAALDLDEFLLFDQVPFTISGSIENRGTMTITSYDINYSINGGSPVTSPITGVSIPPCGTDNFTSSINWNPGSTGVYTVAAWASDLNGNADQNTSNDEVSMIVNVVDAFTQRIPLYETFTSSTCGPCVPANLNMEQLIPQNPNKMISLKYQMSWPGAGDPYFTNEGNVRRNYYSINSVPRMEIDGGWDENGNNLTQQVIDQFYTVPAFIEIDASFIQDWLQGIDVEITIDPLVDVGSNDLVCHVAVFENITYNNVGSNGETEFHHVMKKMLPDENGTALTPLVANTPVDVDLSYEFQGNYRLPNNAGDPIDHSTEHSIEEFEDLGVVVWVQDMATKEVLQAAYAVKDPLSSVEQLPNQLNGKIFPNPTVGQTNIYFDLKQAEYVKLSVYNSIGTLVHERDQGKMASGQQQLAFDASDLGSGLYTIHIVAGDNLMKERVVVN